jgi:hypothetical protein
MSNDMLGGPREDLFGIVQDFVTKLGNGSITPLQAKRFLRKDDPFTIPMDTESQLARWREIYQREFGITLPDDIVIPEQKPGFDRLIVVAKGLTLNRMVEVFRTKFQVYLYTQDLGSAITENERTNATTYTVWVKELVEADPDLASKSANDVKESKLATMTLLERLAYELVYFDETGKHLDVQNVTLCAGSRDSDGDVPRVNWSPDGRELCVDWDDPGGASSRLRARAVVS